MANKRQPTKSWTIVALMLVTVTAIVVVRFLFATPTELVVPVREPPVPHFDASGHTNPPLNGVPGSLVTEFETPSSEPLEQVKEPSTSEAASPARIKLVDTLGNPCAGVACRLVRRSPQEVRLESGGLLLSREDVLREGQLVESSHDGLVSAPDANGFWLLALVDERWMLANAATRFHLRHLAIGPNIAVFPGSGDQVVMLYQGSGVPVQVSWADGSAYDGSLRWFASEPGKKKYVADGEIPITLGFGFVSGVPDGCELNCSAQRLNRKGFASAANVIVQVHPGAYAQITIPYVDHPQYGVELDFSALSAADAVSISLQIPGGTVISIGKHDGPGIWQSPGQKTSWKGVRVVVEGATNWRSELTDLTDAENWQRLVVPKLAPIEVRVQVLDEDLQPIWNAVLVRSAEMGAHMAGGRTTKPQVQPRNPTRRESGDRATPDAGGNFLLRGLPGGSQTIRAAAPGFYSKVLSYEAGSGESIDLGRVVLTKIPDDKNFVRLRLTDVADPQSYRCSISYTGYVPATPQVTFAAEAVVTFQAVDHGDYVVVISKIGPAPQQSKLVWQRHILITAEESEFDIEVSAGELAAE